MIHFFKFEFLIHTYLFVQYLFKPAKPHFSENFLSKHREYRYRL